MAINSTAPVIGIFYGTVLGMNDVTHLGWFDIALISNIPNVVYLAPTCKEEYLAMLDWAMKQNDYPVVLRVPGASVVESGKEYPKDYSDLNKYMVEQRGKDVAVIAAGSFYQRGEDVVKLLAHVGVKATLINPRYLSGLDTELLDELKEDHKLVVTLEDGVLDGGFGEKIARYYGTDKQMMVKCYGVKKEFADRYNYQEILTQNRLMPEQIADDVKALLK